MCHDTEKKTNIFDTGHMYQIVDACVASAEPTEELDAVTVGMICVRNVQVSLFSKDFLKISDMFVNYHIVGPLGESWEVHRSLVVSTRPVVNVP